MTNLGTDSGDVLQEKVVSENKEKAEKFLALMAEFSTEMEKLGLYFAMIALDPERQSETSTVLGYAGNVSTSSACKLMQQWLDNVASGKIINYKHLKTDSTSVQ